MKNKIILLAAGLTVTVVPAHAEISVALAKKCREMMVRAYPTQDFGPHGTAALQRKYFAQCVNRTGKMEGSSRSETAGQGAH